mgnify:CR=1 FL=1|jgi:hypothetical protein
MGRCARLGLGMCAAIPWILAVTLAKLFMVNRSAIMAIAATQQRTAKRVQLAAYAFIPGMHLAPLCWYPSNEAASPSALQCGRVSRTLAIRRDLRYL